MRKTCLMGLLLILNLIMPAQAANVGDKISAELLQRAGQQSLTVVVEMAERADLSDAAQLRDKSAKGAFVVHRLQRHAQRTQASLRGLLEQAGHSYRSYWIANVVQLKADATLLRAIAALPEVALIHEVGEPNFAAATLQRPPAHAKAEVPGVEPGLNLVGAPQVWALGIRGQGVVVGDHDIGVEWQHPALINQYRGWDGVNAVHEYNWRNAFGSLDAFCTDPVEPCDSNGHGTHTTGTMVGDDGAGMQIGMAPAAQWIGCRSLLDPVVGLGTLPAYLDCMEWFIAPYPEGQPELADPGQAPDLVNNSWGCAEACPPDILRAADEATKAAGIVQVGAAGNEGSECSTIVFPLAIYETTFTVGASNFEDQMAGFSSRGPVLSDLSMRIKPNVVAPGVGINSSDLGGSYGSKSGTSMAAPHVSGLVALMISAEPRLRGQVDLIRRIIEDTAIPLETSEACGSTGPDDAPNNVFGHGRIDALAAVLAIPDYLGDLDGEPSAPADSTDVPPASSAGVVRAGGSLGAAGLLLLLLTWRRRRQI